MCCCASPNVNGTPGYRWNDPHGPTSTRPIDPPSRVADEPVVFDEPGRCGGIDAHSHHFQVVRCRSEVRLRWRHGGGSGDARLSNGQRVIDALDKLDSEERYWLLHAMFIAIDAARSEAAQRERGRWTAAAAEKRLKVCRRGGRTRVWIETPDDIEFKRQALHGAS